MTMPPSGQWSPPPQGPPQHWGPPPPSPKDGGKTKWILGGFGTLVVIVITVSATLLATRDSGGSPQGPTSASRETTDANATFASRDDRDSAGIVLDDPTCPNWYNIADSFGQAAKNGWDRRNPAVPAVDWTADQRNQYEAFGTAVNGLAGRSIELRASTPHRVMRELYEQFNAYGRAYTEKLDTYEPIDDRLIRVAISSSAALTGICDAIRYGSAGARAPLIPGAASTPNLNQQKLEGTPNRIMAELNPACAEWLAAVSRFDADATAWRSIDPNIPVEQLSPEQRSIYTAVVPVMDNFATNMQLVSRKSGDPTIVDLATLSAQYLSAYSSALLTYAPADDYLEIVSSSVSGVITEACRSVGAT